MLLLAEYVLSQVEIEEDVLEEYAYEYEEDVELFGAMAKSVGKFFWLVIFLTIGLPILLVVVSLVCCRTKRKMKRALRKAALATFA